MARPKKLPAEVARELPHRYSEVEAVLHCARHRDWLMKDLDAKLRSQAQQLRGHAETLEAYAKTWLDPTGADDFRIFKAVYLFGFIDRPLENIGRTLEQETTDEPDLQRYLEVSLEALERFCRNNSLPPKANDHHDDPKSQKLARKLEALKTEATYEKGSLKWHVKAIREELRFEPRTLSWRQICSGAVKHLLAAKGDIRGPKKGAELLLVRTSGIPYNLLRRFGL